LLFSFLFFVLNHTVIYFTKGKKSDISKKYHFFGNTYKYLLNYLKLLFLAKKN
jgi:hypothetical protein